MTTESSSLLGFFTTLLQLIFPETCYDEFFVKFNFFHIGCLKIALSKCLGYGIIFGSVLVKVPQILKILFAKSGKGISLISSSLELLSTSSSLGYGVAKGFPFSSIGDSFFLTIQNLIVLALVTIFEIGLFQSIIIGLSTGVFCVFLCTSFAPFNLLYILQGSVIPIVIVSKLIQAVANYRNKSTGQLSAITIFLLFFGSIARIFTAIQETGDKMIVLVYVCSTVMNGLIVLQMLLYWNTKKVKKA